jgi:hypothetical protein
MPESRPYRKIARCVLLHKGKLLAQKDPTFLVLPGGGVDNNESVKAAAHRETLEETGAIIDELIPFQVVRVDWTKDWASTKKRKERFKQFRGEEEHIFIGTVSKFVSPTSTEGDEWTGSKVMSIASSQAHLSNTLHAQTAAFRVLHMAKLCALRAAQLIYSSTTLVKRKS